jgi:hypothetical protein
MNGSIARFRSSSRRREKTMTTTRSSKPDIPPVVSMDWNLHIKDCSSQIKQIEKEAYTRKRPMYADIRRPCMDSNNLMQSILYTTEAW